MSDPSDDEIKAQGEAERLKAESDQNRIQFLRTELTGCFIFASVAKTEYRMGNAEHAQRSIADAEKAYATMQHFLSDPEHAKHITDEERQELTAGMERVRTLLDGLKQ
jgi:hypothetical protein